VKQQLERKNNESTDSIQKKRILLVLIAPALVAVERLPGASPELLSTGYLYVRKPPKKKPHENNN